MSDHKIIFKAEVDSSSIKKVASQIKQNIGYAQNNYRGAAINLANPDIDEHDRKTYERQRREASRAISQGKKDLAILDPGEGARKVGGNNDFLAGIGQKFTAGFIGYKALSYLSSGYGQYQGVAHNLTKTIGMGFGGFNQAMPYMKSGANLGFGSQESMGLITSLLQKTGGASSKLVNGIQSYSRAFGVDSDLLSNVAGTVRQTGAEGDDLYRKHAEILASAINSKIEHGRLGEYLQATAGLIEKISSNTFAANTSPISSMMGMLTSGGLSTPGHAASQIANIDSLIRNPSQQQAPLIYSAMAKTLSQNNFKGDMPTALMTWQGEGLAMPDFGDKKLWKNVPPSMLKAYKELSRAANPMDFTKNIASEISGISSSLGSYGLGLVSKKYGFGNPSAAMKFVSDVNSPDFNKQKATELLKSIEPQKEKSLNDISKSLEGQTTTMKAILDVQNVQIGQNIAPAVLEIQKILLKFMEEIMPILKLLGPMASGASKIGGLAFNTSPLGMMKKFTGSDSVWDIGKNLYKKLATDIPEDVAKASSNAGIFGPGGILGYALTRPAANRSELNRLSRGGSGDLGATLESMGSLFGLKLSGASKGESSMLTGVKNSAPTLYSATQSASSSLGFPLVMTQGWRGKNVDVAHGAYGSTTSGHKKGMSGDYSVNGLTPDQVQQAIDYFNDYPGGNLKASFHRKGYYGATANHIHVDDYTNLRNTMNSGDFASTEDGQ